MSMPNLLPRRRQQRNQRLRFWGLLFAASLLVMLAGGFSLRATQSLALQALQSELAGTRAVQKVLRARQPQSAGLKTPSPPSDPAATRAGIACQRNAPAGVADGAALSATLADPDRLYHFTASARSHDRCAEKGDGI